MADDEAVGEFSGLVYVAPDAQRTDARQQSRNVLLSEKARIETMPQLEIYADDVKCSHGATVGQMDSEAILYMRQRGLSEAQARALQIEGFVGDIVRRCGVEPLGEALMRLAAAKLERVAGLRRGGVGPAKKRITKRTSRQVTWGQRRDSMSKRYAGSFRSLGRRSTASR